MDSLIHDKHIHWSSAQDPATAGRTVLEAVQHSAPEIRQSFLEVLGRVRKHLNRQEQIEVLWWYAPLAYIEVRDARWKHFPCNMRMLVSFDLTNGKCASADSINHYAFARRGWKSLAKEIVGAEVQEYTDCGNPEETQSC
jgi:hypothetical protein